MAADRLQRLTLYIGGLMGPFGTVVILPMLPELRSHFGVPLATMGWAFTAYLIPFAALLLVSGTLGERWGRRRTVRTTYIVYALASLACAFAPNFGVFLAARVAQGIANAFITPLLIAGLAEIVPPERFGRVVGFYSSFQALGGGLGPIVGGLAADNNWRFAFIGTAAIALALSTSPPVGEPRPATAAPPIKPLLTMRMTLLGIAFLAAATGPIGIGVLVGATARDVLGLSGTEAGILLFAGAMTALAFGPFWGRLVDRLGVKVSALVASTAVTVLAGTMAFAGGAWSLGVLWALTSGFVGFMVVVFQALGATIVPDNRGGALSYLLGWRFLGHGIGPIIFLSLVERTVTGAFLGAAALGLITIGVFVTQG